MISFENVSFSYTKNNIDFNLDNINIKINDGECVLITGKSGCGKSTILKLINGLIPHYYQGYLSGKVFINKTLLANLELSTISQTVGSVFQNPRSQLFCVNTTSEIAFGCENLGLPKDEIISRIKNSTKQLDIEKLLDKNIFKLSGGEMQQIACASIATMLPEIIVLDEPTANLDAKSIQKLKATINLWKKEGKTIIIAEHYLQWLTSICDRVLLLENGKLKKDISMKNFKNYPENKIQELGLRPLSLHNINQTSIPTFSDNNFSIKNFIFKYKKSNINTLNIKNLNFKVGSTIALIGNNGSGKSTFARCLCGLEKKCNSILTYNDKVFNSKNRINLCYLVMQDVNRQLFTESVLDEILLGSENINKQSAIEILSSLNLNKYLDSPPSTLSGGQKQRLAISSALISNKEIIVFDEPTSGLDHYHMEEVVSNINLLKEKNKTVFIITHDIELITKCCNNIIHLDNGEVKDTYILNNDGLKKLTNFFLLPKLNTNQ